MIDFLTSTLWAFNPGMSFLCIILGVVGFCAYLMGAYEKFGFTQSISITYYLWEKAEYSTKWTHNLRWIFQLFMYFSALMIVLISQTWWYLIVGALFVCMALFPSVLYKDYIYPHSFFAISAIVLGLVGLPVVYGWWAIIFPIAALVGDALIYALTNYPAANDPTKTTKLYLIEVWSLSVTIIGLIAAVIPMII